MDCILSLPGSICVADETPSFAPTIAPCLSRHHSFSLLIPKALLTFEIITPGFCWLCKASSWLMHISPLLTVHILRFYIRTSKAVMLHFLFVFNIFWFCIASSARKAYVKRLVLFLNSLAHNLRSSHSDTLRPDLEVNICKVRTRTDFPCFPCLASHHGARCELNAPLSYRVSSQS